MKKWQRVLLLIVFAVITLALYLFTQVRQLEIEQVTDDLYVIRGVGGNTSVLRTEGGAVVVDSMTFPMQGRLIRAKVEALTGQPVALLINTHYHLDHTHGNPGFAPNTTVVATERTLSHLKVLDSNFWEGDAALLLPNETFTDRKQFQLGSKTITVIHPGRGHTDGDLIVWFEEDQALALGDLFFNHHYPNIDLEAGGSVQAWPATLENVLALNADTIIPGHGATTDQQGLRAFQRFMAELATLGRQAADNKLSLDAMLTNSPLSTDAGYEPITMAGIPIGLNRKFVLRRAWEEATGNIELKNPPHQSANK
ncbi:hypothetical protein GCM10008090_01890 [Arenicella chitinivorans]|uniref:Metallo-beta-lactamase domain-containing protein n=1 Tax=Arenicella chitinivorans TaxID=1329800 RepID=A0A918RFR4_9GAMM|nr:MBL fold metallo-hydrolase [Arenicella chitinivorans]GGZ97232.1 hypothetical protein GCM10008090_01890 [Arenicella chitinivorans]